MDWGECLEGDVKKKRPDFEEAKSLLLMAEKREAYISTKDKMEFASLVIEDYYEIIKELITAILSADGYKSYSHECLATFLEKFYHFPKGQVILVNQLRKMRNDINYRGVSIDYSYLGRNEADIKGVIAALKHILKGKL